MLVRPRRGRFWYNPVLTVAFFGLLGGLSAFTGGEVIIRVMDASKGMREICAVDRVFNEAEKLYKQFDQKKLTMQELHDAEDKLLRDHAENPIIAVLTNKALSEAEKKMMVKRIVDQEKPRQDILQILFMCVVGICLAFFLAVAEPLLGRNTRAAVVNGSVGIVLGVVGGVLVGLFLNALYQLLGGGRRDTPLADQMFARTVAWGILGLFLAAAPGIVLRSFKRLSIGLLGGLVGGILGGLLFDPLAEAAASGLPARLAALSAIGVLAGAATGLIEQAAKVGWMYVTAGLIAGKQFILYRNPTFIGSSPRCEIYLFKDPDISPQHAALHRISGGFELEDLSSATGTRVNGKPVKRARLRHGDEVQIGSTAFLFQEKARSGATPAAPRRATEPPRPAPLTAIVAGAPPERGTR